MRDDDLSWRRLHAVLAHIVDGETGIVGSVTEQPRESGMPALFRVHAKACDTEALGYPPNFSLAGGASTDRRRAVAKAVGEALERYCSAIYDRGQDPLSSYREASVLCVPPSEFALNTAAQCASPGFRLVPFTDTTRVRWTPACEPLTGRTWHVPSTMVYLPYRISEEEGESPIFESISTGLACHCDATDAAIAALCEVVERDAFTITWQAMLAREQILLDTLDSDSRRIVRRIEEVGFDVVLLDVTLDHGIPTIMSVTRGVGPEAPGLAFAAAAHPSPERAARASLEEVVHTLRHSAVLLRTTPRRPPSAPYEYVAKGSDHALFWADPEAAPLADFIFESDRRVDLRSIPSLVAESPARTLEVMLRRIETIGHRALFVDLTTEDVRPLGLRVVRAVVPGFHPLVLGHRRRVLGGRRLWEVPAKLGYAGRSVEEGDNPLPHPLP
jgi:ribosomal protein S12 methylthiotransferase accessory factor